tara:strand:+ start:422 stop:589 length:168 start_codon:yes stop_codon:yes gene_type:complete
MVECFNELDFLPHQGQNKLRFEGLKSSLEAILNHSEQWSQTKCQIVSFVNLMINL